MPPFVRYLGAIATGLLVSDAANVAFQTLSDNTIGGSLIGDVGKPSINLASIFLCVMTGFVRGYLTGCIAKKYGKILSVISIYLLGLFLIFINIFIIALGVVFLGEVNFTVLTYYTKLVLQNSDGVWLYIATVPAIFGGHLGQKLGWEGIARPRITSIALFSAKFLGIYFHFHTILIAFQYGYLPAFYTLCLPIYSEAYWAIQFVIDAGHLFNRYTVALSSCIFLAGMTYGFVYFAHYKVITTGRPHRMPLP